MSKVWVIAQRELASFFDSLIAYLLIIILLGLTGFFTWILDFNNGNVFVYGQADLRAFYIWAFWTLFFFIPAITMRMIAEENRSGTIELLATKAVSDWQIVFGKYLACMMLVGVALLCSLPYYFTITAIASPDIGVDHGSIIGGYFGLLLLSSAYVGIGIFGSSLTNNQIIAFLGSLVISFFFHFLFDVLARSVGGWLSSVFTYLSAARHFDSIYRGVVDSRDLVFFLSVTAVGLVLSQLILSKRNWKD